jgi:hypothetical protein
LLAALACYVVSRGLDANSQLAIEDDPAQIAGRALDHQFDAELARQEINAALAAKDPDLAQSFVELSAERHVTVDPALTEKVNVAVADAASARHAAESFALGLATGLATGEPSDLRGVVDWRRLKQAVVGATFTEPALAIHAAREAVKIERAGGLVNLARNVGRVQGKAGTQAALDSLKIAETPREIAQVTKLAEKEGGKARAILKIVGRGAIALTLASFDLGIWILGALVAVFAFVSPLKSATEHATQRVIDYRRWRRLERYAALTVRG